MAVELLVDGLKLLFPAVTAARVLALLRQDGLVWAAFVDDGFTQKALDVCGSHINAWSPGVLALVALDEQQIANRLTIDPMQPLESGLRQKAVRAYEDSRKKGNGPSDLHEAGLLGLALRERRRYTGSWIGLPAELLTAPSGVRAIPPRTWNTALTCLVNYLPNPLELMEVLVGSGMEAAWLEWVLHILVTQPDENDEQVGRIEQLLREKPVELQLGFLKTLRSKDCTPLVQRIANALLAGHPAFMGLATKTAIDELSMRELANRAVLFQQMAAFQQLGGTPVQADATLKKTLAVLNYWQSGLKLQSFSLNGDLADEHEIVKVLHAITDNGASAKRLQCQAGSVISRKGLITDDELAGLASPEDPQLIMMKAETLYKQGKRSLAVEIAHKAAGELVSHMQENPLFPEGEFGLTVSPERMAGILSEMNLTEDAVAVAETALETCPTDAELVDLTSQLQAKFGNLIRAKELAVFLTGLMPESIGNIRRLSGLCEQLSDWQQAYKYRKGILDLDPDHGLDDQVSYARAALNAGMEHEAAETCENILAESPDEGGVHGLLGITRAKQGRDEEAVLHLNRATLLSPDEAEWWLALAEQQKNMGDSRIAVDILRAGVLAAPDSGAIHFTLGELLLQGGMNAEALPHLKHAASLAPENEIIAFRLGKVLRSMGYLADARRVIDRMQPKWSAHPEIAYEYGQIALSLGDVDAAIPAFDAAARSEHTQPEWLAAYADLLLDDSVRSSKLDDNARHSQAEGFLLKSLEIQPEDLKSEITLADALRKQGKFDEAYRLYQKLVEMPEVVEQEKLWCVQYGFGLTALALHQVEPGITLLREAAQKKSDQLDLQQDLANACLAANLFQDAIEVAERALEIAPDDHGNLDWFAKVMVNLGRADRAAEALRCAIDLTPDRLDLRVRYAQLALENGQIQDAQDALRKMPELDGYDPLILRQAAYLHLRMQETDEAIEKLEKAVMLSDNPSSELLYDLAKVYSQTGRVDDAIHTIQQAADSCRDIQMHLFHADLLARQKRYQAALLVLDRALKSAQISDPCNVEKLPKIHERSALWNRELGNVASAYEHAEKALEYDPEDFELRFLAADLALAMLQTEKASKYTLLPFEAANRTDMDQKGLHLACLSAHLALDTGRIDDAMGLYDVCKQIAPDDVWVRTIGARLRVQKGEILEAAAEMESYFAEIVNEDIHPGDNTLWAAKAAFETYTWDVCFRLFDTFISKYSTEHRGSYELAKTLVEAAEIQQLCNELDIRAHAPGIDTHDDNFVHRFEEILETVRPLLNPAEAEHWQNRAKLVFNPTLDSVRDFTATTCSAMDTAAVMASLRILKSSQTAIQISQSHSTEPAVMLQRSLLQAESEPEKALETVEAVLSAVPEHPLYLGAYAKLAVKAGQDAKAYEAIEKALKLWPDEAKWHTLAGELAMRLDDIKASINHWKEALALQPDNIDNTIELGRAFYLDRDYLLAADVLMKAVNLDESNPDAWLALAYAQHSLDKVEEAVASAVKSSELDPVSTRGLVLASQICQSIGLGEKAVEYARAGVSRDPKDPKAIVNFSRVLNQQGKLVESLEVIEQSIDLMEPEKDLLFERARLIHQMSGAAAAVELVNQLVENYPEEADVLALHATVQAELGDLKAAERSAFRSLRLQPNQPGLAIALGRITRKAGQLDQAVHLLSQAITMNPDNVDAYLEIGQAYIDRREYQLALQSFRHAMRVSPRDPRGYYQAALIMKETKDYPGAETMLEQAARFAPEDLLIHRQLVGVMALNLIHKSQEANRAL
jgi:tetratricopeptide (TPR) repeat protein